MPGHAYRDYLRIGAAREAARPLARALLATPLAALASLLDRYARDGAGRYSIATGDLAGERAFVGPHLPAHAELGALWFDVVDLSTSILVPAHIVPEERAQLSPEALARAARNTCWFALQPIAQFQLAAALDLARAGDELAPAVADAATATRYATWAGKYVTGEDAWRAAHTHLEPAPHAAAGEVRACVPVVWGLRR